MKNKDVPYKVETSFTELCLNQLGMLEAGREGIKIAEQIVGSIDEDGYLRRETSAIVDDLAFVRILIRTEAEVEAIDQADSAF